MQLRPDRNRTSGIVLLVLAGGALAAWMVLSRHDADPDLLWRQAEADFRAGRYARTEAALADLGRLRAPTPLDWMLRAQVTMAKAKTDEALSDLARIPDAHPLGPQARLLRGQLELRRHRAPAAEAAFLEALRLEPRLAQGHRELIYIYGVQLRRPELRAQFTALSQLVPLTFDNVFHWCLTRNTAWEPIEISQIMTRFLQADPDDRWSRLALAESQRHLSKLVDAEKTLSVLPADDPEALVIRVRLALDRGDDTTAESLLAQGPAGHPELERLRGRTALAHRQGAVAVRHFRAAHDAEPDNRDALFGLASALAMVGDEDGAARYRAESRNHDLLGSLMQRIMVPANQNDPKLLRQLGAACEAVHRLPEARAWYNLALGLDPLNKETQQALFRLRSAPPASKPPKTSAERDPPGLGRSSKTGE